MTVLACLPTLSQLCMSPTSLITAIYFMQPNEYLLHFV